MQKRRRQWIWFLMVIVIGMIQLPSLVYGGSRVPNTIRIGLRSGYANISGVEIKNKVLNIGYGQGDRFIRLETIRSDIGFVVKANKTQYYTEDSVFSTYDEADFALLDYKVKGIEATVAYVSPNMWKIYSPQNVEGMRLVKHSDFGIRVEDRFGTALLICDGGQHTPAFAGADSNNGFPLTDLGKSTYRGWFEFLRQGDKITAVNIAPFEEYLYGVIPSEMPASWNMEALKAQALVARSTAIYQSNKYVKDGYNLCDTTTTQVYKGFSGEHPRTNQAVDETRGEVVTYNGKIAETLFFSTSGGFTEDPIYVWGGSYPYLKAVPDPYETEPSMKPWTRVITLEDIEVCLSKRNINIGVAKGIRLGSYTPSGRVNDMQIIGTSGVHTITKEEVRTFFTYTVEGSLKSRMFSIGNGVRPSIPSTSTEKTTVAVLTGDGRVQDHKIDELKAIDRSGKIAGVDTLVILDGKGTIATYKTADSTSSSPIAQEHYGDIVLSGRGYGHGVGMSQSGARGMAKAGYTYDQIIEYYYQGVRVER